jgi:hypothetical protein
MREENEYYQSRKSNQQEPYLTTMNDRQEFSPEIKQKILKDIYYSIDLFDKLIYETNPESNSE